MRKRTLKEWKNKSKRIEKSKLHDNETENIEIGKS